MVDVFPPRNLPGRSESWGRAVEGGIRALEKNIQNFERGVSNWSRSSSGSLAVLAERITEMTNRSTDVSLGGTMSVTGSETAEPYPRVNQVFSFPAVEGSRNALVTLYGNVSTTGANAARLYVYLLYQGSVIGSAQVQPYVPTSRPVEWQNNSPVSILAPLVTSGGSTTDITLRIVRSGSPFDPGTTTITLHDPILTLSRSGVV